MDLERFCFYPFTQLLFQPTGVVSPCCWNQKINLGKLPGDSLAGVWNGEPIRALRREFLEGCPRSCKDQMAEIGCHRWSRRPGGWERQEELFSEFQSRGPRRLDLRLNGKCNLQCVMCDVWQQPNGVYDQSEFWTKGPQEIFPFLSEIDLLGGEPFVQPDTYRLIEAVIAANPGCSWGFVTNGHFRFQGKVKSTLDRVQLRWIQLSLDSLNPGTYGRIRRNGALERALATLQGLREYRAQRAIDGRGYFRLSLGMCVQKLNWRETGGLLSFAKSAKLDIDLQFAYEPESVSLLTADDSERRDAVRYFRELGSEFGQERLHSVLAPLEKTLAHG